MANPFEADRPAGYDESTSGYPFIQPQDLPPAEKLAIDAEDLEEFAEHYGDESKDVTGGQQAP